jgi:hypothetical protein
MEIILGIVAGVAVVGQIIMGVFLLILNKREREGLYKLIKSKDLVEYVTVTAPDDTEEKEEEIDLDVDQIPFLEEREQ